jgi:hypothetical protein
VHSLLAFLAQILGGFIGLAAASARLRLACRVVGISARFREGSRWKALAWYSGWWLAYQAWRSFDLLNTPADYHDLSRPDTVAVPVMGVIGVGVYGRLIGIGPRKAVWVMAVEFVLMAAVVAVVSGADWAVAYWSQSELPWGYSLCLAPCLGEAPGTGAGVRVERLSLASLRQSICAGLAPSVIQCAGHRFGLLLLSLGDAFLPRSCRGASAALFAWGGVIGAVWAAWLLEPLLLRLVKRVRALFPSGSPRVQSCPTAVHQLAGHGEEPMPPAHPRPPRYGGRAPATHDRFRARAPPRLRPRDSAVFRADTPAQQPQKAISLPCARARGRWQRARAMPRHLAPPQKESFARGSPG